MTELQHGFEYKNTCYRSIKHVCQELGKNYWVVLKRLDAGWTLAQAFEDELRPPRHPFKVNGVVYSSIIDAVIQVKAPVSDSTVRSRLAKGMSPEEALFTPPKMGYNNGAIYVITNLVDNKQYVGLTTTSLDERWERHLEQVSRKNASLIHRAIAEFGKENFTIEVLEYATNIKDLQTKEREWIQKLNTPAPNGYNVTLGGELGGSRGKSTMLPGDSTLYPTVKAASEVLAYKKGISQSAAESRIRKRRLDVKKTHGMSKTPIYRYWDHLVHQTVNPKSKHYNGCTVCIRWNEFVKFYEDMGESYKKGLCLKLVDPSLPYSQDNCRWVTKREPHQVHGMTGTRIYSIWSELVHYTTNPKSELYKGIPLCPRWQDFTLFYEDMGREYQEGKVLRLVNLNQAYSKDNCCWIWFYGQQQAHSLFGSPVYKLWRLVVNEYCNPQSKAYNGSTVCDRWRDFALFCEDMAATYQKGFKLIRLDRDKPYSLENCVWKNRQEAVQTHSMTKTKFYRIWANLKHNRTNPTSKGYEGTALCERWQKFENFKADMHDSYEEGMGLKLIDSSLSYSPENCEWGTRSKSPIKKLFVKD